MKSDISRPDSALTCVCVCAFVLWVIGTAAYTNRILITFVSIIFRASSIQPPCADADDSNKILCIVKVVVCTDFGRERGVRVRLGPAVERRCENWRVPPPFRTGVPLLGTCSVREYLFPLITVLIDYLSLPTVNRLAVIVLFYTSCSKFSQRYQ